MFHLVNRPNNRIKKNVFSLIVAVALLVGCLYHLDMDAFATANTDTATTTEREDTTDASVEKAREDAKKAAEKRDEAKEILKQLEDSKFAVEGTIVQLDLDITKKQAEITELEIAQKKIEERIAETQAELEEAEAAEEKQYNIMKTRIKMVYESGNKGYLDALLTATSVSDVMNKMEYTAQISFYDYSILTTLQQARERVATIKQKLSMDLSSNESLQKQMAKEKSDMEDLVEEKNDQVAMYQESIDAEKEELERYTQALNEAEAIIFAAEQASMGGEYIGGVFTWPIPGYTSISSSFGERTSPVAGASSNHQGIDIRCDSGAAVVAAAAGTVIVATYNYAEGNYVVIDHGGGVVSVYMHNSSLAVSVGQSVNAGEVIAYSGSTGISTGPHLHFGVRVNGVYVNPMSYLQG